MAHYPKPWFRSDRGLWYVQLHGKQVNLGPNRDEAFRTYHELMTRPAKEARRLPAESAVVLIDSFLDWCQKHREPRTYDWYKVRCESFCNFRTDAYTVQTLLVCELKPFHVQQWVDSRPDWSDGMKRGAIVAVQRAFNWAVKLGHLDKSPFTGMEKPAAGVRESVITPDLYRQVLEHVKDQEFRDLLALAWQLGARPQELLRLEGRHVDLANRRWVFPIKEAKGKKRIRIVHLTPDATAITQRLLLIHPTGKLLRNVDGVAWTRHAINCRFCRLHKKLGMKLCLYTFRHSFCHRALKNGVDPITLANLMGHVDTNMIARVYANLAQDSQYLSESMERASA